MFMHFVSIFRTKGNFMTNRAVNNLYCTRPSFCRRYFIRVLEITDFLLTNFYKETMTQKREKSVATRQIFLGGVLSNHYR